MKVGRERCVQKPGNHAHNAEILKKPEPEHEKSGEENDHLTGFLEKSSIMRMSLIYLDVRNEDLPFVGDPSLPRVC